METTAKPAMSTRTNLDEIALQAATEIMGIDKSELIGGDTQLKARIQCIVRDAIASATSNDVALYWHSRCNEMRVLLGVMKDQRDQARSQLVQMEEVKDGAYHERNQVVAALAKCFPSGIAKTEIEGWDPAWHNCVYIDLPTGQASWHYHDDSAHLFAGLPPYTKAWDGHSTPTKYTRLAALEPIPQVYEIDYSVQLRLQPARPGEPVTEEPLRFYTFKATAQEVIAAGLQALRNESWCTIWPARTVSLHASHDNVGDMRFTPMVYQALREYMEGDPNGSMDREYTATNGVRIRAEGMPMVTAEELVEGKRLKK